MSEDNNNYEEHDDELANQNQEENPETITKVTGMYKDWF